MAVRLGIIGTGTVGRIHAEAVRRLGLPLTCICGRNQASARQFAAEFDVSNAVTDPGALFASPDVDAVIIGAPNSLHKDLSITAMQAGKDVLVEKPMALCAAECDQMNAVAAECGRILQVGFIARYKPVVAVAKRFIDAGRIGPIYHAKANYYRRRGIPGLGGWFTTKALSGGGPLIDLGVHVIDLAMYLMGYPTPTRVSGKTYARFGPRMGDYIYEEMWAGPPKFDGVFDVEDAAHALVRFDNGATLELNATWAGNFPEGSVTNLIGVFGERGGLSFDLDGEQLRIATELEGHNVDIIPQFPQPDQWEQQIKAFVEAVETRRPPHADGRSGRTVQAIVDAVYESSDRDCEVPVAPPPDTPRNPATT